MKTKTALIIILAVYSLSRLVNLLALPIFNDEAFFLAMGKIVAGNPLANLFINFSDGKEPLFFWLSALTPTLFLARLAAVVLGALALLAIYRLSQKSLFAPLAFIVSPFLFFYQRLAAQENLLFLFLAWGLVFVTNPWLTGLFFGLALLTKTTAAVFILGSLPWWFKNWRQFLIVSLVVGVSYGVMLLLPSSSRILAHNQQYAGLISPGQMIINFKQALRWLWGYQSLTFLLALVAPIFIKDKVFAGKLWLAMIGPLLLEAAVAKIFFPRYFLFILIPMVLLASQAVKRCPWLALCFLPNVVLIGKIISNVAFAPLPYIERWQYIESWPSGYGLKETAAYLQSQKAKNVVVEDIMITRSGLPYYYPQGSYNVEGKGQWYVFALKQDPPVDQSLVWRFSISKPDSREKITVYQKI